MKLDGATVFHVALQAGLQTLTFGEFFNQSIFQATGPWVLTAFRTRRVYKYITTGIAVFVAILWSQTGTCVLTARMKLDVRLFARGRMLGISFRQNTNVVWLT